MITTTTSTLKMQPSKSVHVMTVLAKSSLATADDLATATRIAALVTPVKRSSLLGI